MIKALRKRNKYPPDKEAAAMKLVLQQTDVISEEWANGIPPDEPRNAQAHPIAMVLGNQLSLPVVDGRLGIGRWQLVLLVELDGPRRREVLLQLIDTGGPSNQHAEVLVCSGYREPKVVLTSSAPVP